MPERMLEELVEEGSTITYGVVKPGPESNEGPLLIRGQDVRQGRIQIAGLRTIRHEVAASYQRTQLRGGEVLVSLVGNPGESAVVPDKLAGANIARQVGLARLDRSLASPHYVSYFINSVLGRERVAELTYGSVQQVINLRDLRRLSIPLPPLPVQEAIARVLGTLDDKIASSSEISTTCVQLALAHGQHLLSQFPGREVALADHASVIKGVSYRSADLGKGADRLVTLKCVGRDGRFQPTGLKAFSGEYKQQHVVEHGDIVVAQTDLTQRAEVLARPIRLPQRNDGGVLVASLDLIVSRPGPSLTREVLFALLSTQDFRDHAISYCNGTTVLHMGSRAIPEFRFQLPDDDVVQQATELMAPLLGRADHTELESQTLVALRDALLPGLLSRAIRVREAETIVSEAT